MSTSERTDPRDIERREEKEQTVLYNSHVDVSDVDEAKLVQKIDWRLLPWLSLLYLLSFLDRTSIGNAKVRHAIRSSLTLASFSIALSPRGRPTTHRQRISIMPHDLLLFLRLLRGASPFICRGLSSSERCSKVPSNVFLKRLRPSIWLSSLMLLWGVVMVGPVFFLHPNRF
jgi:hypothetical protein